MNSSTDSSSRTQETPGSKSWDFEGFLDDKGGNGMFEYFPKAYMLNLLFMNSICCGATIGDLVLACEPARNILLSGSAPDSPEFADALIKGVAALQKKLECLIDKDMQAGRLLSAGDKAFRACAASMLKLHAAHENFEGEVVAFSEMRELFKLGLRFSCPPHKVELTKIQFEDSMLDGLFVGAKSEDSSAPVYILLNGTHTALDWYYLFGISNEFAERGIATLALDHPGNGTALYEQGLGCRHDAESYVSSAIDYLISRGDIDPDRIGVLGTSFGGYLAPRATCFDNRIKACICYGALYDILEVPSMKALEVHSPDGVFANTPDEVFAKQFLFQKYGARNKDELASAWKKLNLKGTMAKLSVPFLIVHGENDIQVPLIQATRMLEEAVNSPKAELLVMGADETGIQHCNVDNPQTALHTMADWAAEIFGTNTC